MATTEAVDISPKQDGGVLKQILREGEGEELPPQGCRVKVHYTGTLLDGTQFDSSRDRGQPFSFTLGKGACKYDCCLRLCLTDFFLTFRQRD